MNSTGILVTGEEKRFELLNLGSCRPSPVLIAIGGGGEGGTAGGGGGSGYLNHTTNSWPQKAYIKMKVHPGSGGRTHPP